MDKVSGIEETAEVVDELGEQEPVVELKQDT